jgi:hypothetical protein
MGSHIDPEATTRIGERQTHGLSRLSAHACVAASAPSLTHLEVRSLRVLLGAFAWTAGRDDHGTVGRDDR